MNYKFLFLGIAIVGLFACNPNEDAKTEIESENVETATFASFGDSITLEDAISGEEAVKMYASLGETDTVEVKMVGVIHNVCQKKGCWMNVELTDEVSTFVRFKDYGFFMPFNAAESEVVINGKAFISVTSVDELKHYAEDEGLSEEEIEAITEPEIGYKFLADGVLIKE